MPAVEIRIDTIASPVGRAFMEHAMAEIHARYPDENPHPNQPEPQQFEEPEGIFLVAWLDGKPAACGGLRKLEDGTAEVKRMYAQPWARKKGLGRRILRDLELAARRLGYLRIKLETGVRQPEAIALYESAGYTRCPVYGEFAVCPLSVCFEKVLD
jgi:GNAT superfamily N-acetyltransferase